VAGRILTLSTGTYSTLSFPDVHFTDPLGINDLGQIVGTLYVDNLRNHDRGFLLIPPASLTYIDFPGALFTMVNGINNSVIVVGYWGEPIPNSSNAIGRGFISSPSEGTFLSLTAFNGVTYPTGINSLNEVVGWYSEGATADHRPVTYGFVAEPPSSHLV